MTKNGKNTGIFTKIENANIKEPKNDNIRLNNFSFGNSLNNNNNMKIRLYKTGKSGGTEHVSIGPLDNLKQSNFMEDDK